MKKTIRLASAAKELNLGIITIIEYLHERGYKNIEYKPNTVLTEEQFNELKVGFNPNLLIKINKLEQLFSVKFQRVFSFNDPEVMCTYSADLSANITGLNLKNLEITNLEFIKEYKDLKYLNIGNNAVVDFTPISFLFNLENLIAYNNRFNNVSGIEKLKKLKEVVLLSNKIHSIKGVEALSELNTLYLSENHIKDIKHLASLNNLNVLYLNDNPINNIDAIKGLIKLKKLYLSGIKISSIRALANLKELEELSLSELNLSSINSISELSSLKILSINHNLITNVSPLKNLNNLEVLFAHNNYIEDISPLVNLKSLKGINLSNNPIYEKIPSDVYNAGAQAVFQWIIETKDKTESQLFSLNHAKVLLLGNTNVGKSDLAYYLEYNKVRDKHDTTHGLNYFTFNKFGAVLHIYDFGGQEYFHGTHQLFFSEGALNIIIWDKYKKIRDGQKDRCFEEYYWLQCVQQLVKEKTNKIETILLENKIDSIENEDGEPFRPSLLNYELIQKDFPSLNINYSAVSIKYEKRLKGLIELINEILLTLPAFKRQYSRRYVDLLDYIIRKKSEGYVRLNVSDIVLEGLSKDEIEVMLTVFKNLGILLFYPDINEVKEIVFINPRVFLDLLYGQILNENAKKNLGKIDLDSLNIKNDLDLNANQILALLKFFDVVFQVKEGSKVYFAPQYLPDKSHSILDFFIKYQFDKATIRLKSDNYLLNKVMLKIFKQYGKDVKGNESNIVTDYLFWRDGIVLEYENELLYVQYLREKQYIDLYSNSSNSNLFLQKKIIDWLLNEIVEFKTVKALNERNEVITLTVKQKHLMSWSSNPYIKISVGKDGVNFANWADIQNAKYPEFISNNHLFKVKDFKEFLENKNIMKQIFISYSKDDLNIVNSFIHSLQPLVLQNTIEDPWYCTYLSPGDEVHSKIRDKMEKADIVIFMCSNNFYKTQYIIEKELKPTLKRKVGGSRQLVIPIIIDRCKWISDNEEINLGQFAAFPYRGKPVSDFANWNDAWYVINWFLEQIIKKNEQPLNNDENWDQWDIDIKSIASDIEELLERQIKGGLNK